MFILFPHLLSPLCHHILQPHIHCINHWWQRIQILLKIQFSPVNHLLLNTLEKHSRNNQLVHVTLEFLYQLLSNLILSGYCLLSLDFINVSLFVLKLFLLSHSLNSLLFHKSLLLLNVLTRYHQFPLLQLKINYFLHNLHLCILLLPLLLQGLLLLL